MTSRIFSIPAAVKVLLDSAPKSIVLSGPSGFLGSRVFKSLLEIHFLRKKHGLPTGEIILLSSSPGTLMQKMYKKYGPDSMKTVRASRIDYYTQHCPEMWIDQLGSLGLGGESSVFVNLAAVAGPVQGKPDAMMDVNYRAPAAAAKACEYLQFGHWIQSSTQATNAERAGQVPYSRAKAMMDFALSRCKEMPVSVACLGLLYSKTDGNVGQERKNNSRLNMIDLSLLPLTPIMGDGSALLQPLEVSDASDRFAFLALTDPKLRPKQVLHESKYRLFIGDKGNANFRYYDAVGPETMTMLQLLEKFAHVQGNKKFRPVFIGYRNMERVLNIKSLGNLNRQFVSLLRSEQDAANPVTGDPRTWESVLGDDPHGKLLTLDEAFLQNEEFIKTQHRRRHFPYLNTLLWALDKPKLIIPGIALSFEIIDSFLSGNNPKDKRHLD